MDYIEYRAYTFNLHGYDISIIIKDKYLRHFKCLFDSINKGNDFNKSKRQLLIDILDCEFINGNFNRFSNEDIILYSELLIDIELLTRIESTSREFKIKKLL